MSLHANFEPANFELFVGSQTVQIKIFLKFIDF